MLPPRLRLSKGELPHFVSFTRWPKGTLLDAEEFKNNVAIDDVLAREIAASSPFEFSVNWGFGAFLHDRIECHLG
jgi:hypothetical protein